jgi:hypothetical protein
MPAHSAAKTRVDALLSRAPRNDNFSFVMRGLDPRIHFVSQE